MFWIANILKYIGYVICVFSFIYFIALLYSRYPVGAFISPALSMLLGLAIQFIGHLCLPKVEVHEDGRTVTKHL